MTKPIRHPVFTGLCCIPALLLATGTLLEGTVVGILLAVCSLLASIISLLPSAQVNETRITLGVLFPALFAAFGTLIASAFFPWLTEGRAWLVPLSILSLGLAETFSKEISPAETHENLRDSIISALTLLLTFLLFSFCREVLTYGTLMAYPGGKGGIALPLISGSTRPLFASVAGALLLLALFAAIWRLLEDRRMAAAARRASLAEETEAEPEPVPESADDEPAVLIDPVEHVERIETAADEPSPLPAEETADDAPDAAEPLDAPEGETSSDEPGDDTPADAPEDETPSDAPDAAPLDAPEEDAPETAETPSPTEPETEVTEP